MNTKNQTPKTLIRNSVDIYLNKRQQKALERKAKNDGISKTAVIRDAITSYCC